MHINFQRHMKLPFDSMKNSLVLACIIFLAGCTGTSSDVTTEEAPQADTQQSQETEDIAQMSIHLFDLPEGITEEEYLADIDTLNSFFIASGYGKNYSVLKVSDASEASQYRYALVSSYPSAEAYAASHDQGPEYDAFMDKIYDKYAEIIESEIYRKVFAIN